MGTGPVFFFMHIMKTGGTSIVHHIQDNFPVGTTEPDYRTLPPGEPVPEKHYASLVRLWDLDDERRAQIRLYMGHYPYWVTDLVQPDVTFTVLRDPVDRTISMLRQLSAEAPADAINGEAFNVGATTENYRVREIAQIVSEAFPGCEVSAGPPSADNRSYRVSFTKIERGLPGFRARWTAAQGAAELRRLFERIEFDTQTFEFRAFTRLKQLKYLQRTGQVNEDLFWSER